jgi:hypothetical protein
VTVQSPVCALIFSYGQIAGVRADAATQTESLRTLHRLRARVENKAPRSCFAHEVNRAMPRTRTFQPGKTMLAFLSDCCSVRRLTPSALSSLLNNHIFSFSQYFEGEGPRPHAKHGAGKNSGLDSSRDRPSKALVHVDQTPRAAVKRSDVQPQNIMQRAGAQSSLALTGDVTAEAALEEVRAKSSLGLSAEGAQNRVFEREKMPKVRGRKDARRAGADAFDTLLTMTARKSVNVREQSAILDMQRDFRAKWDRVSTERPVISGVNAAPIKKAARNGKFMNPASDFCISP